MTRSKGWYWVQRVPEEDWQPAWWGPCPEYPGEWRWRLANYNEIVRDRLYRVLKLVPPTTEPTNSGNAKT